MYKENLSKIIMIMRYLKNTRKRKEFMRKVKSNCKKIENYQRRVKNISETDTQVLLVEPILCMAGYEVYDLFAVKRASRASNSQEFDIEVYKRNKLFLAIEVKALSSTEFNIGISNIGALQQNNGVWKNTNGDGVGQLRAYCLNWYTKLGVRMSSVIYSFSG